MLWRDVYNTCKRYTDDIIVISIIRNWLICYAFLRIFNFRIKRKFKLNIERHETIGEIRTDFYISVGIFKKQTFSISDVIKKKKKQISQQASKNKPVVYIDKIKEKEELSDVVVEFYEWKKKMIAKQLNMATG